MKFYDPDEVKEFAQRTERLCEFLLDKVRDDEKVIRGEDAVALKRLKEDAADMQFAELSSAECALEGLAEALR